MPLNKESGDLKFLYHEKKQLKVLFNVETPFSFPENGISIPEMKKHKTLKTEFEVVSILTVKI